MDNNNIGEEHPPVLQLGSVNVGNDFELEGFAGDGNTTAVVIDSSGSFLDGSHPFLFKGLVDPSGTLLLDSSQFAAFIGGIQMDGQHHSGASFIPLAPLNENQRLNKTFSSGQNLMEELTSINPVRSVAFSVGGSEPVFIQTLSSAPTVTTASVPSVPAASSSKTPSPSKRLLPETLSATAKSRGPEVYEARPRFSVPQNQNLEIENLQPEDNEQKDERKGPFKCPECSKVFLRWPQFKRHKSEHLDTKLFKCNLCGMAFNFEVNLKLHEMIHGAELSGCLECTMCPAKFTRLASLKSHVRVHEAEENLVCPECGDEFSTKARLDSHIEEHRTTKSLLHRCKMCGKTFTHAGLLKDHSKEHSAVRNQLKLLSSKKRRAPTSLFKSSSEEIPGTSKSRSRDNKKKLVCTVCSKPFEKPSQLARHMRIHTGEKPYSCSECGRSFNQKNTLESHILSMHQKLKPHVCHICKCQFSQRGNLRAHILKVHIEPGDGEPCFKCDECPCIFRKLASLNSHIAKIHSKKRSEEQVQVQSIATATTVLQTSVSSPSKAPQNESENSVMLIVPDNFEITSFMAENPSEPQHVVYSTTAMVQPQSQTVSVSEVKLVHETEGQPTSLTVKVKQIGKEKFHLCPHCDKSFRKPSDLIRHIRIHTQEKPYKCDVCSKSFSVKSTLITHKKIHAEHKEWECKDCHKRFTVLTSLRAHERLHTGAKPFPCMICGKCFRTSSQRRLHLKVHSRNNQGLSGKRKLLRIGDTTPPVDLPDPLKVTSDGLVPVPSRSVQAIINQDTEHGLKLRPYRCTMCTSAFKKSSHLKQHLRSHTGERPYKCFQCYRNFISSGVLKNHIKTHEGVRAFKCKMCQLSFTTNGSLTRHLATHSEERAFVCPYCHKGFKTTVACRKHIRIHRNEFVALKARKNSGSEQHAAENTGNSETITTSQNGNGVLVELDSLPECTFESHHQTPGEDTGIMNQNHDISNLFSSSHDTRPDSEHIGGSVVVSSVNQMQIQVPSQNQTIDDVISHGLSDGHGFESSMFNLQGSDSMDLGGSLSLLSSSLPHGNSSEHAGVAVPVDESNNSFKINHQNPVTVEPDALPEIGCVQTVTSSEDPDVEEIRMKSRTISEQIMEEIQSNSHELNDDEHVHQDIIITAEVDMNDIEKGKINVCSQCGRGFKKRSDLIRHTRIHTGEKPFKCNICGKAFRVKSTRETHMRTHEGGKTVACHICNNLFATKSSLRVHIRLHTGSRPYKCMYCDRSFRTSGHRKAHVMSHFKPPREAKCLPLQEIKQGHATFLPPVGTIKDKAGIAVSHVYTETQPTIYTSVHTTEPQTSNTCDPVQIIGSLQVIDPSQVQNIHLGGTSDPTTLQISDDLLQSLGSIIFVAPQQTCQIISTGELGNVNFNLLSTGIRTEDNPSHHHHHQETHTIQIQQNPHELSKPDSLSSKEISISALGHAHSGLPALVSISDLETMLPTDNSLLGFTSFSSAASAVLNNNSPMLSSTSTSAPSTSTTDKTLTITQDPPSNNKECPHCGKVFSKPSLLTRHMTVHTGVKPYKCDTCNATFNQKNSLETHKYTHKADSEKPFGCTLCPFKTVTKPALKKHVSRAHPDADFNQILQGNVGETSTCNSQALNSSS